MPPVEQVVVVVNGRFEHAERLLALVDAADRVIAADGGANWLEAHGRLPHVLIGDMDSVSPALLQRLLDGPCHVEQYPPQKDETDSELALVAAAAISPREITILGALGGRIDHTLGNLSLLNMPVLANIHVRIYDGCSYLWLVNRQTDIAGAPGDLVSLIPWGGDAREVCTDGLAYALHGETLPFGPSRGISNVLLGSHGRVTLSGGHLLVVHTPLIHLEGNDGA